MHVVNAFFSNFIVPILISLSSCPLFMFTHRPNLVLLVWLLAAVVRALQSPHAESSALVVRQGLHAISRLAHRNAANQAKLGEVKACAGAL